MSLMQGVKTRHGIGPPLSQAALSLGLSSYELLPGHLPKDKLDQLSEYVSNTEWDDLLVRKNGGNGEFKRKRDTHHPSADRR